MLEMSEKLKGCKSEVEIISVFKLEIAEGIKKEAQKLYLTKEECEN